MGSVSNVEITSLAKSTTSISGEPGGKIRK